MVQTAKQPTTDQTTKLACPECGSKGKKVEPITVESLLLDEAKRPLASVNGFRLCTTQTCGTSYYREGTHFLKSGVRVPIFQKETDPHRLVCYCFEHRVSEIEEEVHRTGSSVVPDEIAAKCKQGLDRCAELNPQGTCCLGNVHQVVKAAATTSSAEGHLDCCTPKAAPDPLPQAEPRSPSRTGLFATGGAVVAAILSSACCWLPLALIGVGASAAGVASFFEAVRLWFLGGTFGLLGVGFYFVYVRKSDCAPGNACEAPTSKLQRMNEIMLWIATAFVAAFATFPNYVGDLVSASPHPAVVAAAPPLTLFVEGMTCAGCETNVKVALESVSGVRAAEVSFERKRARVFLEGRAVETTALLSALDTAGYRGAIASSSIADTTIP